MEELNMILGEHARRYPQMQPADAVKLIYQNEFGGGHLIRDEQTCMEYLRQEYAATPKDPAAPLYEDIGNGILRIHLAAVKEDMLEPLGKAFIRSAAMHRGDPARFQQKLALLTELTEQGIFSFGPEELRAYLTEYRQAGCPAVSHSGRYRETYRPAYRVIRKDQSLLLDKTEP